MNAEELALKQSPLRASISQAAHRLSHRIGHLTANAGLDTLLDYDLSRDANCMKGQPCQTMVRIEI